MKVAQTLLFTSQRALFLLPVSSTLCPALSHGTPPSATPQAPYPLPGHS